MKRFVLLFAIFCMALVVNAAPVSREEASMLAASFLNQRSVTEMKTPFEHFYVFNGEQGFVIIAADDRVQPVLGYSHEGTFQMDMAESTWEWLLAYDHQIQDLFDAGVAAADEVEAAWRSLRNNGRLLTLNRSEVYPLVYTRWRQRSPYNMYCPEQCVTGCVAVVMGQLMKYWESPAHGTGYHSYEHSTYGTLSANFGATEYAWDNMPVTVDDYSSDAEKEAVATLLYHCGVSVEMNYSPDASSTPSSKVVEAMPAYFNYASSMSMVYKSNYTDNQWKQLLKSELDALRPMYYAGQTRGAHAFICDGYDASDLFHFNWGWGGTNDGYYAIGALNPGSYGPFNAYNYAIIDIKPADGGLPAIPAPVLFDGYLSDYDLVLSWLMPIDNPNYTYNVSRNGTLIASGLTETEFVDSDVPSGSYTYQVWTVSNGVESKKTSYDIDLARIDVVSSDPSKGTVWGGGLEELGFVHLVEAIPYSGYEFYCWMENGQVVSRDQELVIVADGDHTLTACFSGAGVDEHEDLSAIRKVEVFTVNGVKLETLEDMNPEALERYAKGVYLLRITTDKGVVTKKIIR